MGRSNEIFSDISKYLNDTYIIEGLDERLKNIEDPDFLMDDNKLEKIVTMDEYFYRLMRLNTDSNFHHSLNTYLKKIQMQLEIQPLLLLDLPLVDLDINIMRRYIPRIDYFVSRIKQEHNDMCQVFRKFKKHPNNITGEEFKRLLLYFYYSIPSADSQIHKAQEYLAKYLLNNPINNIFNYYITIFLIKFFGYKKIREENISETKILIAKLKETTFGVSKNNYVTINKSHLQKILMRNNTLQNKFGKSHEGWEILGIMQTLYHELRHQKQSQEAKNGNTNDIAFFMAARNIIYKMDKDFDYNKNYRCYETEKDANVKGWEEVEKLIKTYMPSHDVKSVMKKILTYKLTEELEQITGIREDKQSRKYISIDLLIQYLDQEIAIKPQEILSKYQQLKVFYNESGKPKRLIDLLKQTSVYKYKEFYFGQSSYRSRNAHQRLTIDDISRLSIPDIKNIINNSKTLMNTAQLKLNKISDRVQKQNEQDLQVISNIHTYHRFAGYLSSITSAIIKLYPQILNNLTIKNDIDSINENISLINNNSLVKKKCKNRISRVGR